MEDRLDQTDARLLVSVSERESLCVCPEQKGARTDVTIVGATSCVMFVYVASLFH